MVGDTGFEPVTPAVSRQFRGRRGPAVSPDTLAQRRFHCSTRFNVVHYFSLSWGVFVGICGTRPTADSTPYEVRRRDMNRQPSSNEGQRTQPVKSVPKLTFARLGIGDLSPAITPRETQRSNADWFARPFPDRNRLGDRASDSQTASGGLAYQGETAESLIVLALSPLILSHHFSWLHSGCGPGATQTRAQRSCRDRH